MESYNENKEITIKIKTLNSTTIPFNVNLDDTIGSLKNKIFQKIRISCVNQRLIFQGKVLDNSQTLSFYKIESEDVIHLIEMDHRNYQPPPRRATTSESESNDNETITNPFYNLFNSLLMNNLNRQNARNDNDNNNNNNNNNHQSEINPRNEEGVYDSFKHLLFPNTFNIEQSSEIISQARNKLSNLIELSSSFNIDKGKTVKYLYNPSFKDFDFKVGQWVDFKDQNFEWIEGQIIKVEQNRVNVHYIGASSNLNEWVNKTSDRIALFRTYTTQNNNSPNSKYYSAFPINKDRNNYRGLSYTNVIKFDCLNNELIENFDFLKEKIISILNQREVIKHSKYMSRNDLFNNERYEMLLIMQLYPLIDTFGRLLCDISYHLMNMCFNYYTDNIYLFRNNLQDQSLQFMNIYDTPEVVMKNRMIQYQYLTRYSILRAKPASTENNENRQINNQQQQPRIIFNFRPLNRTSEEERQEQMRRARRYTVSREELSFNNNGKITRDNQTQTEQKKIKLQIDNGINDFMFEGKEKLCSKCGMDFVIKKEHLDNNNKEIEKTNNNSNVTNIRQSNIKEKIVIEAKSKVRHSTYRKTTSVQRTSISVKTNSIVNKTNNTNNKNGKLKLLSSIKK